MKLSPSTCVLALGLLASACAHQAPPAQETTTVPATTPAATETAAAPTGPAATRCTTDADCASSELCVASTCRAITPELAECTAAVAHFSFDESTLRDADLPLLQRAARCLSRATGLRVTVEGHADERGTTMYNVALGNRRAAAVERYLVSLGASSTQIETASYGEERPVCFDHDESCWAQNRRARLARSSF
jgi:peptidoglycan-associated lipoprotein